MFGAPKQFGQPSVFGQPQQSTFGKPATGAFGQTPAFGQQNTSLFGQTQPAAGVFGQAATPAFGATATSTFGQPATTQSGFGSFGQPQQQQQQQQQPTTSLFGQTNNAPGNTSLFGQPSTSGFGAVKPAGFGFSATQPTSLFGQPSTSTTNTGFGTFGSTATSAFGQTQAIVGGANGTAIAKYQPHSGTDTLMKNGQTNNVNTRQHCITAMKEYEAKSLEELRMEDYLANRKGPQAGSVQPSGGLFGSPPQPTGLFGAPASQQQSTGLFGQQPATNTLGGFGANTNAFAQPTSAFGQPQTSTAGLFGKPTNTFGQMTSTFGQPQQQQQQAPAGGLFGKPFGAPATSASTGFSGFGAPAANATPFGAAKPFGAPTAGGLFGQSTNVPTNSAFAQPASSFTGFNATAPVASSQPPSMFGPATNTGGSMFGGLTSTGLNTGFGGFGATTNTVAGGLFGQKPATGFGAQSTFGAPTASANTGFGGLGSFAPATSSGFGTFGQTNTFNKPAATAFTGFGNPSTVPTLGGGLGLGSNMMGFGGTNIGMQQPQPAAVPIHQHILSLTTSPYGDNPIFKDLKPLGSLSEDALKPTNPAAQKAILEASSNQYKISPKVSNGIKLKPIGSTLSKKSLFGGLEEFDSSVEESFSLKPNAKRLIIKPKVSTANGNTPNQNINTFQISSSQQQQQQSLTISAEKTKSTLSQASAKSDVENTRRVSWLHSNLDKVSPQSRSADAEVNNTMQDLVSTGKSKSSLDKIIAQSSPRQEQRTNRSGTPTNQAVFTHKKSVQFPGLTANDSLLSTKSFLDDTNTDLSLINTEPHPTGITLQRSGYYTIPPLDKLIDYMTEDGSCIVPNFTIGRKGYGNVYFGEPMDVAGLNLDELVHFRHKEVIIYPDDENKPPVGTELNRKAQITLDQVWPHDKTLHEPIKDRERLEAMDFEGKLRAVCDKHDTRFVEYRPETGSWVFKVDHFSKYGFSDSDEDDNPADAKKHKPNLPTKDGQIVARTGAIPKTNLKKNADSMLQRDQIQGAVKSLGLGGFNRPEKEMHDERGNEYGSIGLIQKEYPQHPVSPSADLAMDMGTDSHKLQLMKASFFIDEDYDGKSVISDQFGGRDSPDQIVPSKRLFTFSTSTHSLLSKEVSSTSSSSTIDTPALSPTLPTIRENFELMTEGKKVLTVAAVKPMPFILRPKIATLKASEMIIPLSSSLLARMQNKNIASDIALFHGRRFKIGWSHSNTLTILSTVNTCTNLKKRNDISNVSALFRGREDHDLSKAVVKQLKVFSLETIGSMTFRKSIENHLECQLNYSKRETAVNSDCPFFVSNGGTEALQSHLEFAKQNASLNDYQQLCYNVWSLCVALWGHQEDLDDISDDDHVTIMLRRDLLSQWLEKTVAEKDLLKRKDSGAGYLQHLLKLLTAHKVNEACDLAFNNGDLNLSLLLAQAGSSKVVRALVSMQLGSWREAEADKFIHTDRLKAMMLVAAVSIYESSNGLVNIYENLDWIKSLAANVWYLCSPTASISDALIKYDQASIVNAATPSPAYLKEYQSSNNLDRIQDIRYHILKLYSIRSHPLEKLLNPATHTADLMDFRLSWLLLQVFNGLGYQHCSKQSEAQLHVSFASQLENYGLWHWSIFVLLHIRDQAKRELTIQEFLYRYIDLSQDEEYERKESFIVNKLNIPEKWIYWAKAVRAGAMNRYHAQADYLLKAKQWSMAHEVIMNHIAPDAIINDNIRYIKDLLDRFEDPRLVPNWSNQGMIILDYLDIRAKFEMLKTIHESDLETRWEGLKPQLSELCSRINLFPCPTSMHRLCQSEIAQGLAILVNGMEILCPDINPCLLVKNALEQLPLPEEYAKQKVRVLLDNSHLIEMLKSDEN